MDRLLIALGIAVVAAVVALLVRRWRQTDPPDTFETGWSRRNSTAATSPRRMPLARRRVHVGNVLDLCRRRGQSRGARAATRSPSRSSTTRPRRDLHRRYRIDAVPLLVIADDAGVVRHHFLGPVTATDLWAAMARLRDT